MIRTYVLAANYQHFRHWCRSNGINPNSQNYRYVDSEWTLMGVSAENAEFVFYETWREHPKAIEIHDRIMMIEAGRTYVGASPIRSPQVMEETNGIFTALFWKRTSERMVRAFFIALGAVSSVSAIFEDGFSWQKQLAAAGFAAFGALVVAMGASQFGTNSTDPSFFNQAPAPRWIKNEVTNGKSSDS